jgi:hypothetical protein
MSKASSPRRKNSLINLHGDRSSLKSNGSRVSKPATPEPVSLGDLIRNIDVELDSLRSLIFTILKYDPQNFQRLRPAFTRFTGLLYRKWLLNQISQKTSVAVNAAATIARFLDRVMPDRFDLGRMAGPELYREIGFDSQPCFYPFAEALPGKTVRRERLLWGA